MDRERVSQEPWEWLPDIYGKHPGSASRTLDLTEALCRWFLHNYLPTHPSSHVRRRNPLSMPNWFARLFPARAGRTTVRGAGFTMSGPSGGSARSTGVSVGTRGAEGVRERSTGYNWGRGGQRLGDQ